MTEFKGTKGKWKLAVNEFGHFTSVRKLDDSRKVCVSRVNNQIESNANMLLISKAPEMLEMLEKCKVYFSLQVGVKNDERYCAIEQLIKEATSI